MIKCPKLTIRSGIAGFAALGLLICLGVYIEVKDAVQLEPVQPTPFLEDRNGSYLAEGWGDDNPRGFWEVPQQVPERVRQCFISIEDKRFYEHDGIDFRSICRALVSNLTFSGRQGASTIAMQVARMQDRGARSYWNKLCETVTAYLLVREFGHDEVLRQYLRLVPQGNRMHGVAYAARRYFRKPLQDLGWAEAALLASVPKSPTSMNPFDPEGFVHAMSRAGLILRLLQAQGKITDEEYNQGLKQLSGLARPEKEIRPFQSYHAILRIENMLRGQNRPAFDKPLRSTLDLSVQAQLYSQAVAAMHTYRPLGADNIAIMVVEKDTGKVRGYLGSESYRSKTHAGAINYARTPRSSGSTLKPFIYALGLTEKLYSPASVLADLPLHIVHESGNYTVTNFDDLFLGPMLYRKALANSRNIPAVQVLKTVGIDKAYGFFTSLGLARKDRQASYYGLNMAIGGLYVTLEDLVAAYGMLANDGRAFSLAWFEDDAKKPAAPEQVLPEDVCRQITLFLSDPLARLPSFNRMGALEYPFPVAVKTGTSQGFRDAWAVGYSTRYIVGVWMGHPKNDRMNRVSGLSAADIAKNVMLWLHPDESRDLNEAPFPEPRGYKAMRICPVSGMLALPICPDVMLEYFKPETEPVASCNVHLKYAIDRRTGADAVALTPGQFIDYKTRTALPPEYAGWSSRRDYARPAAEPAPIINARIRIQNPVDGGRFMLDPDTPLQFQVLTLRAAVTPAVPEIVWYVDGKTMATAAYPYEAYLPLEPGTHDIQARFPHAAVASNVVSITVSK